MSKNRKREQYRERGGRERLIGARQKERLRKIHGDRERHIETIKNHLLGDLLESYSS
jgi:hypothetical protein